MQAARGIEALFSQCTRLFYQSLFILNNKQYCWLQQRHCFLAVKNSASIPCCNFCTSDYFTYRSSILLIPLPDSFWTDAQKNNHLWLLTKYSFHTYILQDRMVRTVTGSMYCLVHEQKGCGQTGASPTKGPKETGTSESQGKSGIWHCSALRREGSGRSCHYMWKPHVWAVADEARLLFRIGAQGQDKRQAEKLKYRKLFQHKKNSFHKGDCTGYPDRLWSYLEPKWA